MGARPIIAVFNKDVYTSWYFDKFFAVGPRRSSFLIKVLGEEEAGWREEKVMASVAEEQIEQPGV